jgi:signal transduction histidine kinase
VVAPSSVYTASAEDGFLDRTAPGSVINVVSAVGIWTVVWYMASSLAAMVRERDARLAATNRRLVLAQEEKTRHLLRTTHELKAPFAAIQANAQLLLGGYVGEVSPEAREVVERISTRAKRLAHEIQQMLQLANLRSAEKKEGTPSVFGLDELAAKCCSDLEPAARQRGVRVQTALEPVSLFLSRDHVEAVLRNLISNAVAYSREGGEVRVECGVASGGVPFARVVDGGIGIPPEKLPHVFDEYYRTDEAARHNKESTGLGLTIVRHIARSLGIRVRVESAPGAGTTFELAFPDAARRRADAAAEGMDARPNGAEMERREAAHGVPVDR